MIKLKKSGAYALEGVNVVEMVSGEVKDFGPKENCALVAIGWAEWVAAEPAKEAEEPRRPGRPRQDR